MTVPGRIGDCTGIEALLGEGGMAKVYRARHAVLETRHAIKVLEPEYRANAEARQRFLDEARIQAHHLDHPNIVKVTNIVATADHAALVMELIDGASLEAQVAELGARPDELKRIMLAVLAAVGHAHAAGIIHRDLKPANVLLARVGERWLPKVTDFGIAKQTSAPAATGKTRAGARMGTLGYMSPEQLQGAGEVTARSDIFSLGVMLYELATGAAPFAGDSDYEVMDQIVHGRFAPPARPDVAIDPAVAAVIARALEVDPARRFASCAEMAAALRGDAVLGALVPTSFHRRLRATLEVGEPGLFRWYASDAYTIQRADQLRLELLRTSYRLAPDSHERPHRLARAAAAAVGVDVPIVLYQLHQGAQANAGLCFLPGEAHVVVSGPLLTSLDDLELTALFGHELAHHRLLTLDGGGHRTAAELVEACAAHPGAGAGFVEAALRHRRWTEVFANRGAAIAAGAIEPAIACLVKVGTGLAQVSVADYLAQAREVVDQLGGRRERASDTHPELAVRAIALQRWQALGDAADAELAVMIEGELALETLDLVQQRDLADRTRRLLNLVLAPPWMRTEAILAHARAFFPDYAWSPPLAEAAGGLDEYAAYVLLDFAVVDPALDEVALARVLAVAAELGLRDALAALARKELKLTAGALAQLEQRASSLFARAEQAAEREA